MRTRRPAFILTMGGLLGMGALSLACFGPCEGVGDSCCPLDGEERERCIEEQQEITEEPVDDDGDGWSDIGGDCDDEDPNRHPSAGEACNGRDDDCDTEIDESVSYTRFEDADGDGWGGAAVPNVCPDADGFVDQDGDCDDGNAEVNPDAAETCDTIDQDCDEAIDEGCADTG